MFMYTSSASLQHIVDFDEGTASVNASSTDCLSLVWSRDAREYHWSFADCNARKNYICFYSKLTMACITEMYMYCAMVKVCELSLLFSSQQNRELAASAHDFRW